MSETQGKFVWYELMTTDTEAAKAFYSKVVGWSAQDSPMPGMSYTILTAGESPVGGLMEMPEKALAMGAPPNWGGYIAVDDVDSATEKVKELGGSIYVPPTDIPNIGRFSVVADPQGPVMNLFKVLASEQGPCQASNTEAPGHVGWHELYALDGVKAFEFYHEMFGWQKADAMDMGAMGVYQLFTTAQGGEAIGGMMTKPSMVPVPHWLYYFNVGDIDEAVQRVKDGGGQVFNGPMEVPGGQWILQGMDPQGAAFALVGRRG